MAIKIKCPECGGPMNTRTSEQITNTLKTAEVFCACCYIRAKVIISLEEIKYPNWSAEKPSTEEKKEKKPNYLNPHYSSQR